VRGEVKQPVKERQDDPQGRERGPHVVAKVFRIAEDVAGAPPVIVEPATQRQDRADEPGDVAQCGWAAGSVPHSAPRFAPGEGERRADGSFFGERGKREAEGSREDASGSSAGQIEGQSP
jgi:hypothetical protein